MDIKDVATEQLIKNFPLLQSFLETVTMKIRKDVVYNATTGDTTATEAEASFKCFITRVEAVKYPVSSIEDSPILTGDLKLVVPFSYVNVTPKVGATITRTKTDIVYRIVGIYNVSEVAYVLYIRSLLDESSS